MANTFNLKTFIEEFSNKQIEVQFSTFPVKEDGTKTVYSTGEPSKGSEAKFSLILDQDFFKYAKEDVATAMVQIFSTNPRTKEKATKVVKNFINRTGKFSKIKDRENKELIKEGLKKLKGDRLEVLAYVVEGLMEDESGDFMEMIYESSMNYEINS